jgi:hypothetical protein
MKRIKFFMMAMIAMCFMLFACSDDKIETSDEPEIETRSVNNQFCCTDIPFNNTGNACGWVSDACYLVENGTINATLVLPKNQGDVDSCDNDVYCWTSLKCHQVEYWYDYSDPFFYLDFTDDGTDSCVGYSYGIAASALTTESADNASMVFNGVNWQTGQPEKRYCDKYFNYYPLPDDGTTFSPSYWRLGIDSCDVNMLNKYLTGELILRPWQLMAADVTADGRIDTLDRNMLAQMASANPPSSFPSCSVPGAVGFGTTPYIYVNQKAYIIAATTWAVNGDIEELTRLAHINERLPERFITSNGCQNSNPWGAYNTSPYNLGLGRICYAIKRGDLNGSTFPSYCV